MGKQRSKEQVIELQKKLNSLGYWIDVDGFYGPQSKATEEAFLQSSPLTPLQQQIIETALSFVGQEEIRGNLGFKTPWFHKLMVGVGFQRTHPWCAYFTELVWRESYKKVFPKDTKIDNVLHNLFSASVMQTRNNFSKNGVSHGYSISTIPKPGSLIIWQSATNKGLGHIGIVTRVVGDTIYTIEGNTDLNGSREGIAVAKKTRKLDFKNNKTGLNLICFVNID
jgi:peptidoglycan hydrolase-like protein with peptidoglycan-binding domain